ncbi:MAG: leucyl aminopeptidase [Actinobacteria bacterium]|nr:MAG: leucyl aminopeptidase [Actinomycetota bacterium]
MIEIASGPALEDGDGDLLAVPVFDGPAWGPGAEWVAAALGDWITPYLERREFTGKKGQLVSVPGGPLRYREVVLLGLGDEVDAEVLRQAAGRLGAMAGRYPTVATTLHQVEVDGAAEAVVLGFLLGSYRFDAYKSETKASLNERLQLVGAAAEAEIAAAKVVAEAVTLARDLVNEPAVAVPPPVMAERMAAAMPPAVEVEIIDEVEARERGFGGLLAVSAGSDQPARMVVLRYRPEGAVRRLAFVGKGIVFDSGGLSIKPAAAMEEMKTDMAGAAAVAGAVKAIASLALPVEVVGITPLTENLTGGSAQRPGDVLRAYNGKTIEVLNTDAEGRLVLADGLSLAAEMEPDLIVDVATLTGAAKVALGTGIAALFGNDDGAIAEVEAAAAFAGEKVWRMPLETDYRPGIDSPIADMKNTGEPFGGAIYAALLLKEFVADRPWAHLDIAGPARAAKADHYITQGATGFGVRTLVAIAQLTAAG